MDFLPVNESTSLNTSITIHPPLPLPEDSSNTNNSILHPPKKPESHNTPSHKLTIPHYLSQCETASVTEKSNCSSINNILPCPDSDHNRSRRDETIHKPAEKSYFSHTLPSNSANNTNLSAMRQQITLEARYTVSDKPPMKHLSRPPLNPNEVARGLTALHSKVDELLKKKSQPRGRDLNSSDSERQHRALSTDARSESKVSPQFILTSFQKEPPTPDILSGRTCHSIEIGFNKQQEEHNLSAQINEHREISPIKFNTNIYQDLSLKEKPLSNPIKTSSPPKPKYHLNSKVPSYSPVVKQANFSLESFKPNSTQPISGRNYEDSFDAKEDRSRPKYDERKLDQIISRIKERSSVSPAPGPRGSITDSDAVPAPRYSLTANNVGVSLARRSQDSWTTGKKEERTEDRNDISCSNWQVNTCPPAEAVNEREVNMSINTSMFDPVGKKRSISSPKFPDMLTGSDKKNTAAHFVRTVYPATNNTVNESVVQENKPAYGTPETKNYNNGAISNYTVSDIIKELRAKNPVKVNEPVKTTESFLDRTRALAQPQPESRTRVGDLSMNAAGYQQGEKTLARNYKRGRESENEVSVSQKESSRIFGSLENDMDSVMEANRQKQIVGNADIDNDYKRYTTALQRGQHVGSQRKRSMDRQERVMANKEEVLGRERGVSGERRSRGAERSERNLYEENTVTNTNRMEEDSLLDESVFMSKEENTNRMLTANDVQERQNKRPKVCNRTELFNTPFRQKHLQEDTDLSDFDFDRSKTEFFEHDLVKESFRGFKMKVNKIEEDSARKYDAKKQRRSASICSSGEKIVPKTEMARRGFVGRPAYY